VFLGKVPVEKEGKSGWRLVSDFRLAQCLRKTGKVVKEGLVQRLEDAEKSGQIALHPAKTCGPPEKIEAVLPVSDGPPTLVVSPDNHGLLGILTPFDLL
jgi:hypothetical protein